jgi:tetraacyldisaccharide 4'-kinase
MVEWLLAQMLPRKKVAVLSRGYRRKSSGFQQATPESTAEQIGDEPFQIARKFPEAIVAVDANRQRGIEKLVALESPDLILLDDAFQHRKVRPSCSILLTAWDELYSEEAYLPAGNLRDHRSQARRADLIVVTKCPAELPGHEKERIGEKLKPTGGQELAFASLCYGDPRDEQGQSVPLETLLTQRITVVTGIARPAPLLEYLGNAGVRFEHLAFPDHHHFTEKDLRMLAGKTPILTTEKDAARLGGRLEAYWVLPVKHCFSPQEEAVMQRFLGQF